MSIPIIKITPEHSAGTREHIIQPTSTTAHDRARSKRASLAADSFYRTSESRDSINYRHLNIEGSIEIVNSLKSARDVFCCKYSATFDEIATGYTDGTIRLFNSNNLSPVGVLYDVESRKNRSPVTSIQHPLDSHRQGSENILATTYANGCVKIWDTDELKCLFTIHEKRMTFAMTYHPRYPKFVTVGNDNRLIMYDEETRVIDFVFTPSDNPAIMDGHTSHVYSVKFYPRSNHEFISGGWDNTVQFWDIRRPHAVRSIFGPHICADGIEFSPGGKEILTSSWRKNDALQLWDYGSGKLIGNVGTNVDQTKLYTSKYVSKDFILSGGSNKHLLKLFDLRTNETIGKITNMNSGVYCIDIGAIRKRRLSVVASRLSKTTLEAELPRAVFVSGCWLFLIEFKNIHVKY